MLLKTSKPALNLNNLARKVHEMQKIQDSQNNPAHKTAQNMQRRNRWVALRTRAAVASARVLHVLATLRTALRGTTPENEQLEERLEAACRIRDVVYITNNPANWADSYPFIHVDAQIQKTYAPVLRKQTHKAFWLGWHCGVLAAFAVLAVVWFAV
jgi:hypothetical protein